MEQDAPKDEPQPVTAGAKPPGDLLKPPVADLIDDGLLREQALAAALAAERAALLVPIGLVDDDDDDPAAWPAS